MRLCKTLAFAASILCFSASALAGPCPGASPFTDIAASAGFCTDAEWLKNRSITSGCGGSIFCPGDSVSRAQMAMFMYRLGLAVTPLQLYQDEAPGSYTFTTIFGGYVCKTANVVAASYPRKAFVTGTYSALSSASFTHSSRVVFSMDGGGTFAWASNNVIRAFHAGAEWGTTTSHASVAIPAGAQMQFAIQFYQQLGSANILDSRCSLVALVFNDNSAALTLDAASFGTLDSGIER